MGDLDAWVDVTPSVTLGALSLPVK